MNMKVAARLSPLPDPPPQGGREAVPFAEAWRVWLKIGLVNFGGPAGQIALMHKVLVEEKRWIDETRFLHALNYCMLLPGPEAQQLATYVGWLFHGVRGGLVAGMLFVLPGFVVLLALSIAYVTLGELAVVQGLLFGLKAAVLALVAEALIRISKRALKSSAMWMVAVAAFVAIALLKIPFPLIILVAAIAGALLARCAPASDSAQPLEKSAHETPVEHSAWSTAAKSIALWGVIWLGPVALLALALGLGHVFVQEALFFSKVAVVTFGGAYAVLAYVAQQAVETFHWLRPDEMLTGLGLAETTPGPLILVLVFVGFLAGARGATGLDPILAGTIGAFVTLWVTFAPSFLFIFAGAPFIERLRGNRTVAGALAAVTAAVVGIIANLGLWFALHVLFAEVGEASLGPASVPIPDPRTFDWQAAIIALTAIVALLRFHTGVVLVLVLAAVAGLGFRLLA